MYVWVQGHAQVSMYTVQFLRLYEVCIEVVPGKNDKGERPQAIQGLKSDENARSPTLMVGITLSSLALCLKAESGLITMLSREGI